MKLFYQYMTIFFNFSPTSNYLHPLQVENCDGNSRLVVDEDDNGKFGLERVKFSLKLKYSLAAFQWMSSADPEGGAGGARPPVFAPNSLKTPINWPKYA